MQLIQQMGRGLRPMAKREIALLIGGPCDGKRIEIRPGEQLIRHYVCAPPSDYWNVQAPPMDQSVEAVNYVRTNFSMTNGERMGRFALFLHEPLGNDAMIAVQHLILGYRSQEPIDAGAIMEAMHTLPKLKRHPWE